VLLTELLSPERIRVPLAAHTKDELIEELVAVLAETQRVDDPADVLRAVRAREEVLSTGIGSGIAIPHGRSDGIAELALAAGVSAGPVDFDALDGRPARLFFLLVGPESEAGQHVKALSRLSRVLRREPVREALIRSRTPEEFYDVLHEAEHT
jgi:fructose-specific phosphotransferase system IIA component